MSGKCSGVQQRIRQVAPHAIYMLITLTLPWLIVLKVMHMQVNSFHWCKHCMYSFLLVKLTIFTFKNRKVSILIKKYGSYKDLLIHVGHVAIMQSMLFAVHLTQSLLLWKTLVVRKTKIDKRFTVSSELFQIFTFTDYV